MDFNTYKFMRKLHLHILLLLILSFTSCLEEQEPDLNPLKETKPYFKGTRKINLIVDEAYDLSNTKAHSIVDSVSMNENDKSINVLEAFETTVFFIDDASGEVMAVVQTDTVAANVLVNAKSVTEGLFDMIPAYHSLTIEQQREFKADIMNTDAYKAFLAIIDGYLKNRKPIYSTEPDYIKQVIVLNSYILTNYMKDYNLEGGRVKGGRIKAGEADDFTKWLTRESGATLGNQVHSYVYAEFSPLNEDKTVTTILEPKPVYLRLGYKVALSELGLFDDCYTVKLNQTHNSAKSKNQLALATGVTGLFLNAVFGRVGSESANDCIAAIAGVIVSDVGTTVMGAANSSLEDILIKTIQTGVKAIEAGASNNGCKILALDKKRLGKILFSKASVWITVIEAGISATEFVSLIPYVVSIIYPVDLTEIVQLHEGKLKEACVKVERDSTLKENYISGETIYPGIKLIPQSQYAEWEKSDFEVNWVVEAGNGKVNLPTSSTSLEGKATVGWTLPDNISGEVSLKAEIKDKEGDHLEGSPISFKILVKACPAEKIIGTWLLESYVYNQNDPIGYSLYEVSWVMTVAQNGLVTLVASSDGSTFSTSYYFNNCWFIYNFINCNHKFNFQEGISTYKVGGCGGFSHHIYTKIK